MTQCNSNMQPVATDDDEDVSLDFEAFEAELLCEVNRINGERRPDGCSVCPMTEFEISAVLPLDRRF